MTAPPAGALEACLVLLEKAVPGPWVRATSFRGVYSQHPTPGPVQVCRVPENYDWPKQWEANADAIVAAVNLLKDHGPALLAALRLREGWIPVGERLPPDGELVEVYAPDTGDGEVLDFDGVEEGSWVEHECRREHFLVVGGTAAAGPDCVCTGPAEEAPYTHWRRIVRPTADDLARVLEESATGGEAGSA